ncbi:Ppx/GppA phosphatase family protein [Aurantibacillus circumpalustris]|uniref:Ppx/GppA phosphatase family protein n=1 Tax=Aurantibacillus circumpalustris TaxID=3036359 RepID=UPI00295B7BC1|nr:exopolyphosphatase [Aurantibacillus circumpalustris]
MRIAIIDCGTNTFNLLIVELLDRKRYNKIYSTRVAVKLGEDAINKGYIAPEPFDRGVEAIRIFTEKFIEYSVDKTLAFATSAIRDASNGLAFVEAIFKEFNIEISIIDGNREAELIYFGIREAIELNDQISLIMDIGGGSNEFIIANNKEIFWKQSFNIGAARILEKFKHSNPITEFEKKEIQNYLTKELAPLKIAAKKFTPKELLGSSGAFDSLVDMIHGELAGEPLTDSKTEYTLNIEQYHAISDLVKGSTLEKRKKIKGLLAIRFDMIVISCIMIDHILNLLNIKKIRVSTYSLKEGALAEFIHALGNKTV